MNGKNTRGITNDYVLTNNMAIICCFQYKRADDYQDLKKRNVLTDLNKYMMFCTKTLGLSSSNIVILSDIEHLNQHVVSDKILFINSGSQFEQTLRNLLSLLTENSFLFFAFSGHGESLDKSCHYVIPTGMSRSHYISGRQIQQLFYYHLPQICTCLLLIDTCYSGGLLSLKYKVSDTLQLNKKYLDMGANRCIVCFHSSSKSELSAVFYEIEESGSVFSHYLLIHLIYNNNITYIPNCLNIITKQIYSQRKFSRQPIHHPFVQCTHPGLYYNLQLNKQPSTPNPPPPPSSSSSFNTTPFHKGGINFHFNDQHDDYNLGHIQYCNNSNVSDITIATLV